jgi:hypothetical protein
MKWIGDSRIPHEIDTRRSDYFLSAGDSIAAFQRPSR